MIEKWSYKMDDLSVQYQKQQKHIDLTILQTSKKILYLKKKKRKIACKFRKRNSLRNLGCVVRAPIDHPTLFFRVKIFPRIDLAWSESLIRALNCALSPETFWCLHFVCNWSIGRDDSTFISQKGFLIHHFSHLILSADFHSWLSTKNTFQKEKNLWKKKFVYLKFISFLQNVFEES